MYEMIFARENHLKNNVAIDLFLLARGGAIAAGFGCVFGLDEVVGIEDEVAGDLRVARLDADAYPVHRAGVVGRRDPLVAGAQLGDAVGLALHGHDVKLLDVKIAEHVPAHVEYQHRTGRMKLGKRHFLFDVVAQ